LSEHPCREECPYKPGLFCLATVDLAVDSRCLECPRIPQSDLLSVWESFRLTTRTVSGRSRGSNPLFVINGERNTFAKPLGVCACVCATDDRNNLPISREKPGKEELASV